MTTMKPRQITHRHFRVSCFRGNPCVNLHSVFFVASCFRGNSFGFGAHGQRPGAAQAGGRRNVGGDVHHRPDAGHCAGSGRSLHEAGGGRGVRWDDIPSDGEVRDGPGWRPDIARSRQAEPLRNGWSERRESGAARTTNDARVGGGGARAWQAGQRRGAVFHRARRSTRARQSVHGLRACFRWAWRFCRRSRRRR